MFPSLSIKESWIRSSSLDSKCSSNTEHKMKLFIIALCVFYASAYSSDKEAGVVRSNFESSPEGGFNYGYETENGISGSAVGTLKQFSKDEVALSVEGSNQYQSPEGEVIQLSYTADENGYRPVGAHLPTPPPAEPIPEYIARAIAYIAAHPYVEKKI